MLILKLRLLCVVPESMSRQRLKVASAQKTNEAHLQFARAEGRVIVTRDQDFLRVAAEKSNHSGIVFYTANQSMREIIEALILIYEVMLPDEMSGRVEYLG